MAFVSWTWRVKEGERRVGVVGQITVGGCGGVVVVSVCSAVALVLEFGTAGRRLLRGRCRSIAAY